MYYKKYYLTILKNLNSNFIFYKYYKKIYKYKDSLEYTKTILSFLSKKNIKKKVILTYSNKSFKMYSSIFPILISGNIWVPLSINLPIEKIKNIISQTKPHLCLYDYENSAIIKYLKKNVECVHFNNIDKKNEIKATNIADEIQKLDIASTAFIYFTSGSTGLPKGIIVSHKNIISDVYEQKKHLYKNSIKNLIFGDYYDTAFSIFFDIFFPAIFFKSTISPSITKSDNYYLLDHYKKNKINNLVAVPSTFGRIKDILLNFNDKLVGRNLILTGEPFYLNLLDFLLKKTKFQNIFNCYGGTEMGNWIFFHKCNAKDVDYYKKYNLVPIGKPFSSVKFKIKKNILIASGPMITNGYTDKKLNKEIFFFGKVNSFYTGDRIKKINANYICVGRGDKMVKINGYRIEIPDIEANFRKLSLVKEVVVFMVKEKNYNNYLVAVISLIKKITEIELKKKLEKYLSNYMIPRKIIFLNNLPKNSNGKIDRLKIINKLRRS